MFHKKNECVEKSGLGTNRISPAGACQKKTRILGFQSPHDIRLEGSSCPWYPPPSVVQQGTRGSDAIAGHEIQFRPGYQERRDTTRHLSTKLCGTMFTPVHQTVKLQQSNFPRESTSDVWGQSHGDLQQGAGCGPGGGVRTR